MMSEGRIFVKRAVIIGGKGKVGTYLVPMLVEDGFEVINVSRGNSKPFIPHGCWDTVKQVSLDRDDPDFPQKIAALEPDIIVDKFNRSSREYSHQIAGS
jgi:nucleoside-diphosphate-sugar epimerase